MKPDEACIWKYLCIFYVTFSSWFFLRTRASFCPVIYLYIALFGIPDNGTQTTIQSRCRLICFSFWDHVPIEPFVLSLLKLISADETSQNTYQCSNFKVAFLLFLYKSKPIDSRFECCFFCSFKRLKRIYDKTDEMCKLLSSSKKMDSPFVQAMSFVSLLFLIYMCK